MLLLCDIGLVAHRVSYSSIPETSQLIASAQMVAPQDICLLGRGLSLFETLTVVSGFHDTLYLPRIPVQKLVTIRV
jgi:hypothetical protein